MEGITLENCSNEDLVQSLRARTHGLTFSKTEEEKAKARLLIDQAIAEIANRGGQVTVKDTLSRGGYPTKKFTATIKGEGGSWIL